MILVNILIGKNKLQQLYHIFPVQRVEATNEEGAGRLVIVCTPNKPARVLFYADGT